MLAADLLFVCMVLLCEGIAFVQDLCHLRKTSWTFGLNQDLQMHSTYTPYNWGNDHVP